MIRRQMLRLAAPLTAFAVAVAVSAVVLALSGNSPITAFTAMLEFGTRLESVVSILNRSVPLYLSGLAVAIGFRMGLLNIGVEGQYRLAALIAASVGAAVQLPPVLHVAVILIVAMAVGAAWAGIAAILKVTRGVSEVISTIMLNTIATGVGAWLLANRLRDTGETTSLNIQTPPIPESGRLPNLNAVVEGLFRDLNSGSRLQGFIILAVLVGLAYYLIVDRTRFGFDLRATGINPFAAQISGAPPRTMIVSAMLLSGAVAGLVGMSPLLGFFFDYSLDFPVGLGFAGIAVALVGRNHPVGIALGALIFAFLDRSSQILDIEDIPKEIVTIMQGVIILSIVVAYEVVARAIRAQDVKDAAAATSSGSAPSGGGTDGALATEPT